MAKSDRALEASMQRHRPVQAVRDEMSSTVFGQLAQEAQPPADVRVDRILPSPYQQRAGFDEAHIEWLMTSIGESGLVSPVVVRKLSDSDTRVQAAKAAILAEGGQVSESDTWHEQVAGHNRREAFRRLGRPLIPAIVRVMTDAEAARALTVDNTLHRTLADWELFKHIRMLREHSFVKNVTDLAAVMGCSRAAIYNLEAFGVLPQPVQAILETTPNLIGGSLAYELKAFIETHADLVVEAVELLAGGKIKQAGVVGYVQRKLTPRVVGYRKEVTIRSETQAVKMVMLEAEATIAGDIDFDKLRALIEANLADLKRAPEAAGES